MNDLIILQASLERIAISLERIANALTPRSIGLAEGMEMLMKNTKAPDQPLNAPEFEPATEPEKVIEPTPTVEPEKPEITIDQIRKMVVTLSAMGKEKKDAVREIITSYAPNVSGIPVDKYPEVMDKLTALKEG